MPKMGGTSSGVLIFVTTEQMARDVMEDEVDDTNNGMRNSSLKVDSVGV